jgi:hypothetical protein
MATLDMSGVVINDMEFSSNRGLSAYWPDAPMDWAMRPDRNGETLTQKQTIPGVANNGLAPSEVAPGIEPGSGDSESPVLATTPRNQLPVDWSFANCNSVRLRAGARLRK